MSTYNETVLKGIVDANITRCCIANQAQQCYPNNSISTSKYNFVNFLPKNLAEQFSKMANLYFLALAMMQIIPAISISDGVPTILIPLICIVIITGIKDFSEDYKRKKSDRQENMKLTHLLDGSQIEWRNLLVGNIIRVERNEYIPADILILATSESKGLCFIETKNLDGETNMKQKNAPKELCEFVNINESKMKTFSFEYEPPNAYLYQFQGTCYLTGDGIQTILKKREILINSVHRNLTKGKQPLDQELELLSQFKKDITTFECPKISISNTNFILRGSSLRNTSYIYGLVTYTGHDTKIMKNSFKARAKKSQLEKDTGKQIMLIFFFQVIICFFAAIFYTIQYMRIADDLPYLQINRNQTIDNSKSYNLFVRLGNWILMFGNFVPISLLVSLEMVKFIQAMFISKDDEYMTSNLDNVITPCVVQSSNLNEELGQISYIFSDKTGTLTCNLMEFKKFCVSGISYGEIQKGETDYIEDISNYPQVTNVDFRDKKLIEILQNSQNPEYGNVDQALMLLSLCHTIITEQKDSKLIYNASSPDELALVNFARFLGYEYQGINEQNELTVRVPTGEIKKFKLFHILEFDSTRKRNSVIVKDLQNEKYMLLTKGADSIILDRKSAENNEAILEQYQANLGEYGKIGLRTLLLASKEINEQDFLVWNEKYHVILWKMQHIQQASTMMDGREQKMNELQNELEQDLMIIAATAIEDKLQDKVGETIHRIRQAGIKVWVLTGDKVETAINIGYSCQLLSPEMKLIKIEERDEKELEKKLKETFFEPWHKDGYGLVLTGDALALIFKGQHSIFQKQVKEQNIFNPLIQIIQIAEKCESVVCCRVSPAQKQQVVSIVRKFNPEVSTLSIGDGANDVSMITAAHVGVGIKGVEGQQAARASDYAIGEFKMLRPLLFVHGRESYRKNSTLVLYNFFKNIILVFPQFWFSIFNNFSGQTPYDSFIYQLFNVFYTALPIILFAVFDEEHERKELYENKTNFYKVGLRKELFSSELFWGWFFSATLQSVIIAFFSIYDLEDSIPYNNGRNFSFWWTGTTIFGMTVVVTNFKIVQISNSWNLAGAICFTGSLLVYLITLLIAMTTVTSQLYQIVGILFSSVGFHLNNILIIGATTFIDYGIISPCLVALGRKCQNDEISKVQPVKIQQDIINDRQIKIQQQDQELAVLYEN